MRPKLNLKSKSQMSPSYEHIESKILSKIKIFILTRAELLFNLCYEIPCTFSMALYHKWDDKNDFAYVIQFFSLISESLGSVSYELPDYFST